MQTVKLDYTLLEAIRQCFPVYAIMSSMIDLLLSCVYAVSGGMYALLGWRVVRHGRRFRFPTSVIPADDLPSITICIPARNEAHAMSDCLETVLASRYEKLEVIVYDDASIDDTPALVKAFAHEGVRFIAGEPLPKGWNGKTHALEQLWRQANGEYVVFMDVDVQVAPESFAQLLSYIQQRQVAMVSVFPRRNDWLRASTFFSPLRFFWEIALHREAAPAAAGPFWAIRRDELEVLGGFSVYAHATSLEAELAKQLAMKGAYRPLISTAALGISYQKKWRSQLETSLRLLYPSLGSHWATVGVALLDLLVLLAPFVSLVLLWNSGALLLTIVAVSISLLAMGVYGVYCAMVWRHGWWIGALLTPIILVQEIVLLVASAIAYSRRKISWKGRPLYLAD